MNPEEITVTLPASEWAELLRCSAWLDALEEAGVDNWDGISYAHEIFAEYEQRALDDEA